MYNDHAPRFTENACGARISEISCR
uniref:Uncharacterized protein n=1 Tax=Anguilla anguilla TaxID=7936 RepID=A0A0E9SE46_ANGAN